MNQSATVNARLDRETKERSEAILKNLDMTPTDAVRLLYRQIALRGEFPVELRVPDAVTAKTLTQSDRNEEIEYRNSIDDLKASWSEQ